jgi:hypothetical protein
MSDDPGVSCEWFNEQRIAAIKRWVAYIKSEPPETWGPQQDAVVNDQLAAAQHVGLSAAHHRAVSDLAEEITKARDDADQ